VVQPVTAANEVTLDGHRAARIGFDEAILCPSKTDEHLQIILDRAHEGGASLLLTRMTSAQLDALESTAPGSVEFFVDWSRWS
jgi:NCAIR mutase (PurE)-related protein